MIFLALFPHTIRAADIKTEDTATILLTREEKQFIHTHKPLIFSEVNWKPMSIADNPNDFDGMIADYFNMISIINKVLKSMSPKEHRAIYPKGVSVEYDTGIDYFMFGKIMAGAVLILIIVIYWNRKLSGEVAERKLAERRLMENEKRVKTILDAINTGIIIINPENRIIEDVNPAAARMIGLSRDLIIGRICHEFICPMKEKDCPIIDHRRPIDNSEQVLLTTEGHEIPILKTVIPVTLNKKQQLLESFVNLTDRKAAEKELQRNYQELERFYTLTVGREEKMIDLKKEINHLLLQAGQDEKYKIR